MPKPTRLYKPVLPTFVPIVGFRALVMVIDFPRNPQPHLVVTSEIVGVIDGGFETQNSIYRRVEE